MPRDVESSALAAAAVEAGELKAPKCFIFGRKKGRAFFMLRHNVPGQT